MCVVSHHTLALIHQEMVEDSVFVWFFAIERVGSLPASQIAWQEITKRLVSKSDFLPCEFFLLAQRQDSSWPAQTEVELITTLESVLWLGRAAGWKENSFSGAVRALSVLTPSLFILTSVGGTWWQHGLATGCLMKVIISHDASPPQRMVASCRRKSCIQEITSVFHFVSRHQNSGKSLWHFQSHWAALVIVLENK